jgi:S-adenosylmethionine-diacylglycerol 3-amino-3-carboxypropyl transferase
MGRLASVRSEAAGKADFSGVRYGQCWEDADILLEGLDVRPGDTCVSIASAGDNSLALLAASPARVIALDLSPAQLACLELRVAAYRLLSHGELLELVGSRPSERRIALYERCRPALSPAVRDFWGARRAAVAAGIGAAGKFEHYFALFRERVLPLIHSRRMVDRMLAGGSPAAREQFYERQWNTLRWRLLFRIFFSRFVMGRLGRDSRFFDYVDGSVADRILARGKHALTTLDPAANPYLQWIVTGYHPSALPYALRPEHFETIRANLDRLEWHCISLESFLDATPDLLVDRFNLSDIFEYMSPDNYALLLARLVRAGRSGTRLAYWNMLAPRSRPDDMADVLRPLLDAARSLHERDKAFFYTRFVLEEVI